MPGGGERLGDQVGHFRQGVAGETPGHELADFALGVEPGEVGIEQLLGGRIDVRETLEAAAPSFQLDPSPRGLSQTTVLDCEAKYVVAHVPRPERPIGVEG
jgi:hypothetical protein